MKRKIISLLLCLVMALSLIPTVAFAATEDLTTNGEYSSNGWSAGGSGTITTDGLTLSKTAQSVDKNTYRINLTVTTTQTTTTVTTSSDAATVLVIDCSGSMAWCTQNHKHTADCYSTVECTPELNPNHYWRGEHIWLTSCRYDWDSGKYYTVNKTCGQTRHTHDNASGGQWCENSNLNPNTDSRIASAKVAAKAFLDTYKDTTAARWVAVVSFASRATSSNWFNVSTNEGYKSAIDAINDLSASGGTNLDAGLRKADELMSLAAVSDVDKANKNVIALTDGVPTESANHGDGRYGSSEINAETAGTATALKENVNALYTICFAASGETCYEDKNSPTVDEFLSGSIASSSDTAHTADDASELNLAFGNITSTITSGLTGEGGWTVTDPMARNIDVTGTLPENFVLTNESSKTYTWTLKNPTVTEDGSKKVYTYDTSYTVTIDPKGTEADGTTKLREDKFYPTNEVTTLYYTDANGDPQTADFPVPGVKVKLPDPTPTPGSLTIEKELAGDGASAAADKTFTFKVMLDGQQVGDPVTIVGEGTSTVNGLTVGNTYTVVEVEEDAAIDGYNLTTTVSGTATVSDDSAATVTVTNTYTAISTPPVETVPVNIPVTKTVSAKVGSTLPKNLPSFTFKAYLGEKEVGILTLALNEKTKVSGAQNQYRGTLTANIPAAAFANNNNMVTLTIKEDKGIDTKWKYDTREYTVTVRMVIERAVAEDPLVIMLGNDVVDSVSFENIYSYKYTPAPKPTTPAKPVTSVKTGDMGVALYAGLAILSMTGSAGVILRRRKNDK